MTLHTRLSSPRRSSTSLLAALGSVVSLGAQGLFAVFLLKLFDATAVGQFSVASQIAFCWATLALAQSPLSLLVNRHTPAHSAAAAAWGQSVVRLLWLSPWAALALWWSQSHATTAPAWLHLAPWVVGIALLQMSWLLAQSLTLRQQASAAVAWVRLLPPVLAALLAWLGAAVLGATDSSTLLGSALLGYAAGALWMLPALATSYEPSKARDAAPPNDERSTRLKMLHTLTDVAVSGLLAVQWQALYGTADAGLLLVLLRVFGFIPGLVHSAWAQVVMSEGSAQCRASLRMAVLASAVIALMALAIQAALQLGWLQASWQGLNAYLWPLACWQMAACVMAAHAHLPFAQGRATRFSWQCIGMNAALLALLCLPLLGLPLGLAGSAQQHLLLVSGFMTLALLAQTLDHGLRRQSP
jgi:uncharacterized membrane protein YqaE (UPF0057 family)